MVQQSTRAVKALSEQPAPEDKRLVQQAQPILPLVECVIAQTRHEKTRK